MLRANIFKHNAVGLMFQIYLHRPDNLKMLRNAQCIFFWRGAQPILQTRPTRDLGHPTDVPPLQFQKSWIPKASKPRGQRGRFPHNAETAGAKLSFRLSATLCQVYLLRAHLKNQKCTKTLGSRGSGPPGEFTSFPQRVD